MSREMEFDPAELSLVPVAVDTWRGFVFVNPDASAPRLLDVHPALEPLAVERNLGFADWDFRGHWVYDIPANWKVYVENAVECYHCPTVHTKSFSDAFVTDANVYELVELGGLLCQFTSYNARRSKTRWGGREGEGFRFIYMWPTSFWAQDDQVAFTGMIVPTGIETCAFHADVYARPGADEAFVASGWRCTTRRCSRTPTSCASSRWACAPAWCPTAACCRRARARSGTSTGWCTTRFAERSRARGSRRLTRGRS